MAGRTDESWNRFFAYFNEGEIGRLSPAEVVERFRAGPPQGGSTTGSTTGPVSEAQVRNWRRQHSRPLLTQLPEMGYRWSGDPLFFARLLGAIPGDGLDTELLLQRRIIELRQEVHALEDNVRSSDSTEATGAIIAEAATNGKWAVAVHPAFEGPHGYPIHVADRLDFKRIIPSGKKTRDDLDELWSDMHNILGREGVMRAPRMESVWATGQSDTSNPFRFSVAHTEKSFSPYRMWPHINLNAVAIVSATLSTWPMNVAALVARILGYGFTSTRGLTRGMPNDDHMPDPDDQFLYRTAAHEQLLQRPWDRYVWGHFGSTKAGPSSYFSSPAPQSGLAIVWLRESDELLVSLSTAYGFFDKDAVLAEYHEHHRGMTQAAGQARNNGATVYELPCRFASLGSDGRRAARWERTFQLAADIVTILLQDNMISKSDLAQTIAELDRSPHPLNSALHSWLISNGQLETWVP